LFISFCFLFPFLEGFFLHAELFKEKIIRQMSLTSSAQLPVSGTTENITLPTANKVASSTIDRSQTHEPPTLRLPWNTAQGDLQQRPTPLSFAHLAQTSVLPQGTAIIPPSLNRLAAMAQQVRPSPQLSRNQPRKWFLHVEGLKRNWEPKNKKRRSSSEKSDGDPEVKDESVDDEAVDDSPDNSATAENNTTTTSSSSSSSKDKPPKMTTAIQYIAGKSKRHVTFSKRKAGLMKKAQELAVLTGSQALVVIASETNHIYTFSTPGLKPLLTDDKCRSFLLSCLSQKNDPLMDNVENGSVVLPTPTVTELYEDPNSAGGVGAIPVDSAVPEGQNPEQFDFQSLIPQMDSSRPHILSPNSDSAFMLPSPTSTILPFPVGPMTPQQLNQQISFTQPYISCNGAVNSSQFPIIGMPFIPADWSSLNPETSTSASTSTGVNSPVNPATALAAAAAAARAAVAASASVNVSLSPLAAPVAAQSVASASKQDSR